jgi:branched-chain amino acid aminotransferase
MTLLDPPGIPADDRAFLLGDGLFETLRLYRGRPFRLTAHLERLEEGAERLGIPVPGDLRGRVDQALEDWGDREGALRVTVSRGAGAGLAPAPGREPLAAVQIREWRPEPRWWKEGFRAHLSGRVHAGALTAGIKGIGYLERIQALRDARARGGDEAILLNERGLAMGGSASNLLVVEGSWVTAPGPGEGALSGITREVVLGVLEGEGYRVREQGVEPEAFSRASEVLLTSSLREVVPVVRVGRDVVGSGAPGQALRIALQGLRKRASSELGLQGVEHGDV